MLLSCDQHHFRHVHTGRPNKFAHPTGFIDMVAFVIYEVFSVNHCPRTPVILPESVPRHLPCYVVAQRNSLPTGAVAPFVVCKDKVQSDCILTATAPSTSPRSLPITSPLCLARRHLFLLRRSLHFQVPCHLRELSVPFTLGRPPIASAKQVSVSPENVVWQPAGELPIRALGLRQRAVATIRGTIHVRVASLTMQCGRRVSRSFPRVS